METTLRSYPPGIRGSVAPMTPGTAEVVICGAGIAGIATAYHLTRQGVTDIVLVDERPPLSLTSDKSTECYRNVWPGPGDAMVAAMNRSIDLLEELARESGNVFRMNRRGYLFASADPGRIPRFIQSAQERSEEHTSELQSLAYLVCRLLLRSEEHTSELQSLAYLVCRLLLRS